MSVRTATARRAAALVVATGVMVSPARLCEGALSGPGDFAGTADTVSLFSPFAALDERAGVLRVPVVAWIHEKEDDRLRRLVVKGLERALGVPGNTDEERLFRQRIAPFLADNERGETLEITVGAQTVPVGTTDKRGYIERVVVLAAGEKQAAQRRENGRVFVTVGYRTRTTRGQLSAVVIPPEGVSVVSDIDDTIKITEVLDREAVFKNTFTREFRAVPGMAALYQRWEKEGAMFHYVSASPWQLMEFLEPFLKTAGFPAGTFHLRPLRAKSLRSIKSFLTDSEADKRRRIEDLCTLFPSRRFVLVGDSAERDPEIYGHVARLYASQVQRIYIRKVRGAANTPERFAGAFEALPPSKWRLFEDPSEITITPIP